MTSKCPINASLVVLGDRWSLLVVRDLLFAGYRTFNQFLKSGEGMATNVLTDRLSKLIDAGIITKEPDPEDGRKSLYTLTPKGIELAPVLLELSKWGTKYQHGIPPEGVLETYEADRAGFLAGLRSQVATAPPSAASKKASARDGVQAKKSVSSRGRRPRAGRNR